MPRITAGQLQRAANSTRVAHSHRGKRIMLPGARVAQTGSCAGQPPPFETSVPYLLRTAMATASAHKLNNREARPGTQLGISLAAGVVVSLDASLSANDFAWMILNSGESSRCFEGNLMLDGWSTSNPRQMLAQPRCYQTLCTSAGLQIILGSGTSALLVCAIQSSKTFALLSHRRQQYNMRSLLILRVFRSRLPCGRWRSYTERLYWCVLCYLI